jgi:hypothetical protein
MANADDERNQTLVARRRGKRFFGASGLCERYEQIGDELIEFGQIVELLTVAHADLDAVRLTRLFVVSTQLGAFPTPGTGLGRHPARSAVRGLLDLVSRRGPAVGQYPLRPSLLTVEMAPAAMRARRSDWVQWLRSQDLPVPAMLAHRLTIDHRSAPSAERSAAPPAAPEPVLEANPPPHPGGPAAEPPAVEDLPAAEDPPVKTDPPATDPPAPTGITEKRWRVIWPLYIERVRVMGRRPTINEDHAWQKRLLGTKDEVSRAEVRLLRKAWAIRAAAAQSVGDTSGC